MAVAMNHTEAQPTSQIVWDEENTVKLIKAYQAQNVLWNAENHGFLHRIARYEAWRELANVMQLAIRDVKRKMNSLIGVYRAQCRKGVAHPRWWTSHMSFLNLARTSGTCDNSENIENSPCNEPESTEPEYIPTEPVKRSYASAFLEFQAELETRKREFAAEEPSFNVIRVNPNVAIPIEPANSECERESDYQREITQERHILTEQEREMSNEQEYLPHMENEREVAARPEREVVMESGIPSQTEPVDDEDITLYVRYLECKLKKYPSHTRNTIQFEFNRILYEADLGLLDKTVAPKFA